MPDCGEIVETGVIPANHVSLYNREMHLGSDHPYRGDSNG